MSHPEDPRNTLPPAKSSQPSSPEVRPSDATGDGAERRRSPRYDIQGIRGKIQVRSNARVMNLSIDGLAIQTSMSIRVGEEYVVHVDTDRDVVPLRAKAVWCNLVGTDASGDGDIEPVFHAGLQIGVDLSGPAQDILQFIEKNSPIEIKQRLYGRFEVSGGRQVSVQRQHQSEIRTLNQHGLLMETHASLEPGDRIRIEVQLLEQMPFRANGRVVFVGPSGPASTAEADPNPSLQPLRRVGVEFDPLEDLDRLSLQGFLEELAPS